MGPSKQCPGTGTTVRPPTTPYSPTRHLRILTQNPPPSPFPLVLPSSLRTGKTKHADNLATGHSGASYNAPTWSFTNDSSRAIGERAQCVVRFQVPYDLGGCLEKDGNSRDVKMETEVVFGLSLEFWRIDPSVFLYYKLTN
jgi:hypothetical protein